MTRRHCYPFTMFLAWSLYCIPSMMGFFSDNLMTGKDGVRCWRGGGGGGGGEAVSNSFCSSEEIDWYLAQVIRDHWSHSLANSTKLPAIYCPRTVINDTQTVQYNLIISTDHVQKWILLQLDGNVRMYSTVYWALGFFHSSNIFSCVQKSQNFKVKYF